MSRSTARGTGLLTALLMLVATVFAGCSTAAVDESPPVSASVSVSSSASADAGLAPATATSDLPTVPVSQLPAQAVDTLELIDEGGPFPYDRDGVTFQNREGILPSQPQGFYSEYTVITPGSKDRGARRIVAGDDGSRFYTDDHYDSFREVVSG